MQAGKQSCRQGGRQAGCQAGAPRMTLNTAAFKHDWCNALSWERLSTVWCLTVGGGGGGGGCGAGTRRQGGRVSGGASRGGGGRDSTIVIGGGGSRARRSHGAGTGRGGTGRNVARDATHLHLHTHAGLHLASPRLVLALLFLFYTLPLCSPAMTPHTGSAAWRLTPRSGAAQSFSVDWSH